MTRKIRFRAWNKKDEAMYDVYSISFLQGGINVEGTGVHIGNGWATASNGFMHDCDVALMQYTGIKDSKGNEICEGDICHCVSEHNDQNMSVFWKDGHFLLRVMEGNAGYKDLRWLDKTIIGNIYENPKLLCKNYEKVSS